MSIPTSHNFDIPGFAFHPSRFTLLSHVANLFLLKGNPYNLNLLLILEHPQAELLYCLKTRQIRPIMASRYPSTNQKLVLHWPNSMYLRLCRRRNNIATRRWNNVDNCYVDICTRYRNLLRHNVVTRRLHGHS